jgi:cytochrome P450
MYLQQIQVALHQEYQDSCYSEILNAYHDNVSIFSLFEIKTVPHTLILLKNEIIDYDFVNNLEYLEMCIQETLRMYPPAVRFDRVASEDYRYNDMFIPKGTVIASSTWAMHHDPQIYPEPYKFDPER